MELMCVYVCNLAPFLSKSYCVLHSPLSSMFRTFPSSPKLPCTPSQSPFPMMKVLKQGRATNLRFGDDFCCLKQKIDPGVADEWPGLPRWPWVSHPVCSSFSQSVFRNRVLSWAGLFTLMRHFQPYFFFALATRSQHLILNYLQYLA